MRATCSITRANLDQAVSDRRELGAGERARWRDRGPHAVHQPERGSVENEPHLIGSRAVYDRIERFQMVAATNFTMAAGLLTDSQHRRAAARIRLLPRERSRSAAGEDADEERGATDRRQSHAAA
jgi:hypothetical protein